MSQASLTFSRLGNRSSEWRDGFVRFAQRHRDAWPAVAIIVATVAAYHFTLTSLFDFLRLDTPLAYLPLLPLFCIGIAVITARRYAQAKRPIKDRQIDFLVGVPMVVLALLLITLAPVIASAYYWSDRADVVSLALFAAGATIIGYGITWFWRLKSSFVFLLLMWPALYLHLMAGVMQKFTDVTNGALARIVHLLPLGVSLGSSPGQLFVQVPHGTPLQISIVSACSGANSVLGFALIGGAILTVMGGGKGRKLLWWIAGMALAFGFNILRLMSILFLAHIGHPTLALGGYHAVIGLVLFAVLVLIMLWVLPWFGVRYRDPVPGPTVRAAPRAAPPAAGAAAATAVSTAAPRRAPVRWTRGRVIAASTVV
ncbi:MAG: exosortase/archaeosortase family protein, partial [Chloroflexi bacterium]